MEELREKLLTLLKEIDYICKKYDITYYAEGGTIIGALRHNGFIPWDDDMDLVMTRDNFNKFLAAFKKEKLPNRVLECPDTNKNYPLVTIKYNDTTTTTIFRSLMNNICACGVYVDIFVLDPVPKGKEEWFKQNFLSYTELLCPYYIINDTESSRKQYKKDLKKVKKYGRDKVLEEYRKKLFCYPEEGNEEYLIRWGITYQTVKIDYYSEPRYVKFEDTLIPIPKNAEQILANYFGDDWYMIPESQNQITHNFIQDLNHEYKLYMNDYMRYINKDEYMKNIYKLKELKMRKKDREVYNTIHVNKLNSYKDSLLLKNKMDKEEIKKLFNSKRYNEVKEYSDLYFNLQNRGIYKKSNILLDLDLETCYYIFMNAIITGEYYKTAYIIDLFMEKDNTMFLEINNIVQDLKKAKGLYFENKYEECLEIVDKLLENNKYNCSAYKIKLDIILKEYNEKLDYENELKLIDEFYKYTGDIELKKYEGDIYLFLDNKGKAFECYEKLDGSRNGLLLLDIKKKTE